MYQEMLALTERNEAFYFADYERFGNKYRVFNYRLASWTDFQEPYAIEMRGITYLLHPDQGPVLVSRPFAKFFNLGENPSTMNLDLSRATMYEEKADGSLIATFYDPHTRKGGLKSKQAFFSDQATMAEEYLIHHNPEMLEEISYWTKRGYTVLMELCSPANRIVLEYPTTHLKVHGIRNNLTGEYIQKSLLATGSHLAASWVDQVVCQGLDETFVSSTLLKTGIEGYVIHFRDGVVPGDRVKLKTTWYANLHKLKEGVETAKSLIESILYERIDDVKTMFSTDTFTLNRIKEMEDKVIPVYNHIVKTTEEFSVVNKDLSRKDFAIKGQKEIPTYFHLAMNKYLGKEADYRGFCMKFYKELFNQSELDIVE